MSNSLNDYYAERIAQEAARRLEEMANGIPSETNGITSETTLLPCPFCGGEAKAYQHGDVGYVVQCRRCGIWNAGYSPKWSHITDDEFGGFIDEESAIAAWNTRAERKCRKVIPNEESGYVFCSECGAEIGEYNVPNYCHMCGAKVVD